MADHPLDTREESFFLAADRGRLAAMLHAPPAPVAAVVFCHPLFEERKNAYRCYVDTARLLAGRGIACLRFDYFGTGDSEGDHAETDLEAHLSGIRAAMAFVRERFGVLQTALLGLRLGATLAAHAVATDTVRSDLLILWEPVVSGRQLLSLERKRQKLRDALTKKEAAESGAPIAENTADGSTSDDIIDLDGNAVSRKFWGELEGLSLPDALQAAERVRVLLLQISFREQASPQIEALVAPLREREDIRVDVEAVKVQPVWNRLDPFDWSAPGTATAAWIEAALGKPEEPVADGAQET